MTTNVKSGWEQCTFEATYYLGNVQKEPHFLQSSLVHHASKGRNALDFPTSPVWVVQQGGGILVLVAVDKRVFCTDPPCLL